ncbi:acyl-CoA reductase [Desulfitobacterium sp.]|uniref:acyl-CoA reductase n=1 Tax=Desulfitobacterium sp. TaxID=49981 RepID=UPI002BAD7963|nr:acyl-CoA reductase [Desulfitobacterium sp.]HVJ50574.1 acyl-CoA reductase [Desulfitobacterium sp.]
MESSSHEEFDNPGLLDGFRPQKTGGMSRVYGPELIFHVFSGNVPGLPLWSMIMGLLLKSGGIGKSSSSEPLMPVLFAQSLAQVDRKLADCIAILPWKGGTADLEEPVLKATDAVIVYGSSETVQRIREQVTKNIPVLGYGHKVSFAAVGREALTTDRYQDTVHRLAHDVMVYDQQSCLSPQAVWVEEGGVISGRQFAQLLAAELENYEKRRPRAKLTDEEAIAIRSVRNRYEALSFQDEDIEVYASSKGTEWTVIYEGKPGFEGSPLNRTLHVYACRELREGVSDLRSYRDYLQTVGLAVSPSRLEGISELLAREGVTRITALGQMTLGVPGWHHDGRFNLLDLVRFVDIERSAEQLAEIYDPDVE